MHKKVCFDDEPIIYYECIWVDDYKLARIGEWQMIAIDRMRFLERIKHIEAAISFVFEPKHRTKIQLKNLQVLTNNV